MPTVVPCSMKRSQSCRFVAIKRHVICETSVPPLEPSTARESTLAFVAVGVGRYGDVATTAPAGHLSVAGVPSEANSSPRICA
jgi:hypothetical protein